MPDQHLTLMSALLLIPSSTPFFVSFTSYPLTPRRSPFHPGKMKTRFITHGGCRGGAEREGAIQSSAASHLQVEQPVTRRQEEGILI